jgi:hypothetical protein
MFELNIIREYNQILKNKTNFIKAITGANLVGNSSFGCRYSLNSKKVVFSTKLISMGEKLRKKQLVIPLTNLNF